MATRQVKGMGSCVDKVDSLIVSRPPGSPVVDSLGDG